MSDETHATITWSGIELRAGQVVHLADRVLHVVWSYPNDPRIWSPTVKMQQIQAATGETPADRQRKLDEARKQIQQAQAAQQTASGMDAASPLPPWGGWPNIVPADMRPDGTVKSATGSLPAQPDFGAAVSGELASARGIDRKAADEHMRVPSFEEVEAERARMAEHFRKRGIL